MRAKRHKIDKSVLAISEPQRIVDKAYRKSFEHRTCVASRNGIDLCDLPSVGAHMNDEGYSGWGQKVSDDEILPLCHGCHADQTKSPGTSWWYHKVLKPQARRMYRDFRKGNFTT